MSFGHVSDPLTLTKPLTVSQFSPIECVKSWRIGSIQ